MKKIALTVVPVLLLIAAVGWYFFSPQLALAGLRDAAVEGDADAVMDYIDLPAFKSSVKDQLKQQMAAEMSKGTDNSLGVVFGTALVDPMIDTILTEENIAKMVENRTSDAAMASAAIASGEAAPEPEDAPEVEIERTSFDEFRVHSVDGGEKGTLIFRRDGLGWRLSGMDMPDTLFRK